MSYASCDFCAQGINPANVLRTGGKWFHRTCYDGALRVVEVGHRFIEHTRDECGRAKDVENSGTDDPQPISEEACTAPSSPWEVWVVKVRRKLIAAGERDAKRKVWTETKLERMAELNPDLHYEDGTLWMSVEVSPEEAAALVRPARGALPFCVVCQEPMEVEDARVTRVMPGGATARAHDRCEGGLDEMEQSMEAGIA